MQVIFEVMQKNYQYFIIIIDVKKIYKESFAFGWFYKYYPLYFIKQWNTILYDEKIKGRMALNVCIILLIKLIKNNVASKYL